MIALLSWLCAAPSAWGSSAATPPPPPPPAEPAPPPAPVGPDRSGPPAVPPPDLLELPLPEVHALGPGVDALYVRTPGARKIAVHVVLRRGLVDFDQRPTMIGRAAGWVANVAAGDLTGAELANETTLLEAEIGSVARLHETEVTLEVPADDPQAIDRAFELTSLVLHEPSFPKKELSRWVTDQNLYYTVNGPTSQARLASAALSFGWFSPDHPYGARPDLDELGLVKSKVLRTTWARWLGQARVAVVVTGDVAWDALEPRVKALVAGIGADVPVGPAIPYTPAPTGVRVVAIDLPGQEQVAVRMRAAAPARDAADAAAFSAMNFVLGGNFLSRLNHKLREEKGYTYGAGSTYTWGRANGEFTVSFDVGVDNLAESLADAEAEIDRMCAEPVTAGELEAAVRSYAVDWNRTFETASTAVAAYRRALGNELDIAQLRGRVAALGKVTPEDVRASAAARLKDQPRLWVLVGDRAKMEPELTARGWTAVEWVNPYDAILGKF